MRGILEQKKGQVGKLVPAILALVLAAIILTFGLVFGQEVRDTQTAGTEAYTAANETVVALGTFADFWELIVLAIVIGVVITILFANFGRSGR